MGKDWIMAMLTIGLSEVKANFGKVTAEVNRTGNPVTVFKNNKPWVVISPAVSLETVSNPVTLAAMEEADQMVRNGTRFDNLVDMMAALEKEVANA
jgi:antitoxin Phd